jgi:hypothetical protein
MKEQKRFADRLQARDEHVMTPDVGQFMQKHSLHLAGGSPLKKPTGTSRTGRHHPTTVGTLTKLDSRKATAQSSPT